MKVEFAKIVYCIRNLSKTAHIAHVRHQVEHGYQIIRAYAQQIITTMVVTAFHAK